MDDVRLSLDTAVITWLDKCNAGYINSGEFSQDWLSVCPDYVEWKTCCVSGDRDGWFGITSAASIPKRLLTRAMNMDIVKDNTSAVISTSILGRI